ncbi:uncharacterized protein [Lolium perenne]|uniref:uncharacterized protein isoform X2 n=1 Tax=Lolium perenne TaxID=4522 RepID=UPI003A9A06C1
MVGPESADLARERRMRHEQGASLGLDKRFVKASAGHAGGVEEKGTGRCHHGDEIHPHWPRPNKDPSLSRMGIEGRYQQSCSGFCWQTLGFRYLATVNFVQIQPLYTNSLDCSHNDKLAGYTNKAKAKQKLRKPCDFRF